MGIYSNSKAIKKVLIVKNIAFRYLVSLSNYCPVGEP